MKLSPVRLLLVGLVLLAGATTADARASQWGFGYDRAPGYQGTFGGLGLRYHFGDQWGVGFRVNPSYRVGDDEFYDRDFESNSLGEELRTGESIREDSNLGVELEFLAFREARLGRWLGLGPFAGVSYAYSRGDTDSFFTSATNDSTTRETDRSYEGTTQTVTFTLGLRPTFHLSEHMVLETRFGVGLRFQDSSSVNLDEWTNAFGVPGNFSRERTERASQEWGSTTFGESLGLRSVLSFMIYL